MLEPFDQAAEVALELGSALERLEQFAIAGRGGVGCARLVALDVAGASWPSSSLIGVSPAAVLNTRHVASSTWTRAMWSRRCGVLEGPAACPGMEVGRDLLRRRRDIALRPAARFGRQPGRRRVDGASPGATVCGAARSAVEQVCISAF
jgi:hypothetical protein